MIMSIVVSVIITHLFLQRILLCLMDSFPNTENKYGIIDAAQFSLSSIKGKCYCCNQKYCIGEGSGGGGGAGGGRQPPLFLQFLCGTGKNHKCTKMKGKIIINVTLI